MISLHDLLMSIGFTRRILVNRELRRLDLENRRQDLENRRQEVKLDFALHCQSNGDGREYYAANPDRLAEVKRLGIDKELPDSKACNVFLYGEDIDETLDDFIPQPVQMPNTVSVSENEDGTYDIRVIQGEKFRYFSPYAPAFNYNYTKFLWNGVVYTIPREYYGKPLDGKTMDSIAREIIETQNRLIDDIDGVI